MRLVLTVVSLLVVLAIGGLIARSQLRASQPLLNAVAGASAASATSSAPASEPTGTEAAGPVAALISSSASGAKEPTPQQQKQFMDALSKIMQQKPGPNDGDGK